MNKITAIRFRKDRGKRVNIFLDGRFAFSLEACLLYTSDAADE